MRRLALAFVLSGGLLAAFGATAPAASAAPAPAEVQCPAQAGTSTLSDGSARPVAAQQAEVVTCRYGTEGDAVIQVTYGARNGTFPIGCHKLDQRTDLTVGSGFDPTGALQGDHFGGTIDDPDHALSTTWMTTHAADANATKAAALELAGHLAPLARGCGAPTSTRASGGTSSGTNTPAAIALLGGGLLVTAGGVLLGVRGGRAPATPVAEPSPPDDRIVSGRDAINVLLQAGLVQPVTRPDGTTGYKPVGDLAQFDHNPQWRPKLTGQPIVDGEQFHDIGALAYNEHPDGTFDTATIVVGVQRATPPPPVPAASAPVPVDPDATPLGDALAKEFLPKDLAWAWVDAVDPPPYMPPPFLLWPPPLPPSAPVDNTDAWNRAPRNATRASRSSNRTSMPRSIGVGCRRAARSSVGSPIAPSTCSPTWAGRAQSSSRTCTP